jgi:hypothetical protein
LTHAFTVNGTTEEEWDRVMENGKKEKEIEMVFNSERFWDKKEKRHVFE